jgi:hypothetical protein
MTYRATLYGMATKFDLGLGVELVRIPSTYTREGEIRWYVTRDNSHILHCVQGWVPYTSVVDGNFFFPNPEIAFSHFVKIGYETLSEGYQDWKNRDEVVSDG